MRTAFTRAYNQVPSKGEYMTWFGEENDRRATRQTSMLKCHLLTNKFEPHTDTSQPHYLIAPCWDKFQGDARGVLFVWVKKGKQIRRELKLGMRLQLGDQTVRILTLHFIYNNKRGFMTVVNEP